MRLTHLFAGALIVLVSAAARADTYETLDLNATAGGVADWTVSGTLTFDTTTSKFTNSDLTTSFGSITGAPTVSGQYPVTGIPTQFYDGFGDFGYTSYIVVAISGSTMSGYSGGPICSAASSPAMCISINSFLDEPDGTGGVTSFELNGPASLTPAISEAPEPASLILLATGSLLAAGFMRRRRFV